MALEKLIKVIAWLMSTLDLVWQLSFIVQQYMRYPFNTDIAYDVPKWVKVPAFYVFITPPAHDVMALCRPIEDNRRVVQPLPR